jgi:hypothetical protein
MRSLLAALASALLVAACAAGPPTVEEAAGDPAGGPEVAISPPPDAGPVPDAGGETSGSDLAFTAPLVGGGQLDAGSLEGRDVVLWFWAPW